jgi:hypothetical protein
VDDDSDIVLVLDVDEDVEECVVEDELVVVDTVVDEVEVDDVVAEPTVTSTTLERAPLPNRAATW